MADYSNDFQVSYDEQASACTVRFRCFDTPNSVTVRGCAQPDFAVERLLLDVRRACLEFHALWSFSRGESDVSRVNEACGRIEVDDRTARLVEAMRDFHGCEPSFDFTIGPVSFLWKHAESVPDDDVLAEALSHVGAELVSVEGNVIEKADPLARIDVGGAAKGFVADEVARMLRDAGVTSAEIDLGGNLFMIGRHPAGRDWRVAVRIPKGMSVDPIVLQVRDKSVVTSGSYERFVEIGGMRYHHIIDASTGRPSKSDIVSATVVAESSLEADLLATTALMTGSDKLGALAARHRGCGFVAIVEDGSVLRFGQCDAQRD